MCTKTIIETFSYQHYYNDGSGIFLTNFPEAIENCLVNDIYPTQEELQYLISLKREVKFSSNMIPLPILENNPMKYKIDELFSQSYMIHNQIFFITEEKNYIKICSFGTHKSLTSTFEFCANSLNLLKNFIFYFETKASDIIKFNIQKKRTKLSNYLQKNYQFDKNLQSYETPLEESDLPLQQYFMNINGKKVKLSPREIKCLTNQVFGYSIKEISNSLNISTKTVENHLYNAKKIIGPINKQKLRELLLKQHFIQYFIPDYFK